MGTAIKHPVPDRVNDRQSARMSKITTDGCLTRSGTGCFIWKQRASKGFILCCVVSYSSVSLLMNYCW